MRAPGRGERSKREFDEMVRWIIARDGPRAAEAARVHVLAAKRAALTAIRELNSAPPG
jgi:DNA-binding GntR family transcriptional regulator